MIDFPAMEEVKSFIFNLFFFLECYHFMTHAFIFFRVRLLPRKDLVRSRHYFLIDTGCVFIVNFLLLGKLRVVAIIQIIQHLYYYITWDKSELAKKVISWSSLEWQRLPKNVSPSAAIFETVGTLFDLMVHLINSYLLAAHLSTIEVILGIALVHVFVHMLLYNPMFAWSAPSMLEPWVEKRLTPLSKENVPHTVTDKLLGQKPVGDSFLAQSQKLE